MSFEQTISIGQLFLWGRMNWLKQTIRRRRKQNQAQQEREIRYTPPPLTQFDGYLRCIRQEDLENDPVSEEALRLSCPKFMGRDVADSAGLNALDETLKKVGLNTDVPTEAPYNYRRYAGRANFPRGRYFSVSMDEWGNDGGTLGQELAAYTDMRSLGPVFVRDTVAFDSDDWLYFHAHMRSSFKTLQEMQQSLRGTILFHYNFSGGASSKEFAYETYHLGPKSIRLKSDEYAVFMPTSTCRHRFQNVLDLRRPEARNWLIAFLDKNELGVGLLNSEGEWQSFNITSKSATVKVEGDFATYPSNHRWDGNYSEMPEGLPRLLSYLLYGTLGGTPITEILGNFLQSLDIDGLIFPSARSDLEVYHLNGEILSWKGWNFVDFRGESNVLLRNSLVIEPESWRHSLAGFKLHEARREDPRYGSFKLDGPTEALQEYLTSLLSPN